jgi:hypothetical protein
LKRVGGNKDFRPYHRRTFALRPQLWIQDVANR